MLQPTFALEDLHGLSFAGLSLVAEDLESLAAASTRCHLGSFFAIAAHLMLVYAKLELPCKLSLELKR